MNIDLNIQDAFELNNSIKYLSALPVTGLNLTHKSKNQNILLNAKVLKSHFSHVDIIQHLSAKLLENITEAETIVNEFANIGINKFLIVSGDPKNWFDSIAIANYLEENFNNIEIFFAYNCALDNEMQINEDVRLLAKLSNNLVKGVFLQITDDFHSIEKGVEKIRKINEGIKIYSSILLPTEDILSKMKSRPWTGVKLSKGYLENIENATEITSRLLLLYKKMNIIPLFEVLKFNEETHKLLFS